MNKIVWIVMLVFCFLGISSIVMNIVANIPLIKNLKYVDMGLTIVIFMFLFCYIAKNYENNISSTKLTTMEKYQKYIELINNIYNFDYSNLKVIQKIFYKDNKFCIVLNDVKVWIVKEALLSIKAQEDLIELDNILIKDILENKANLTLDTHGYQIYVNGALESLR